jgi:hypothetical protein
MNGTTLRGRLNRVLFHWLLLFVIASAVVLYVSSSGLRHDVEEERQLLARTIAGSLDATLSEALRDAAALERDLSHIGSDTSRRLRMFRFESPFRQATYLLDGGGGVLASDPPGAEPLASSALGERPGITPLVSRLSGDSLGTVAVVHPFRREGETYYLVAEMELQESMMSAFLREVSPKEDLHIAVIDENGRVIGASDRRLLYRGLPRCVLRPGGWSFRSTRRARSRRW